MALTLVEVSRNTRGLNSREIKFNAIGKYIEKTVERESKPIFNEDGSPKLDDKGNQVREPLGKDENGKQITYAEKVQEFTSEGVLTDIADAMSLVGNDEQRFLDIWAEGYNDWAYRQEADKDELDEFLKDMNLDEEKKGAFKRAARQVARSTEVDLIVAAEMVKTLMERQAAKAAAAKG